MKIKKQSMFFILTCLIWTQSILVDYFRGILMRLPIIGDISDGIITLVFLVVIVLALPSYKITRKDIVFMFFVTIIFIFDYFIFPANREIMGSVMAEFLLLRLPLYIVGVSLSQNENRDQIISTLYILSVATLFVDIIYRFTMETPMTQEQSLYHGAMAKAYNLLPHCCLIAYGYMRKKGKFKLFCTILSGVYLLMLGTRGPVLLYFALIAVMYVFENNSRTVIARTIFLFGCATVFFSSPLYETSLLWMYQKAQSFGLSVRVFDKLLSGTANVSAGRSMLAETLLEKIVQNPVLGYGICSDRLYGAYAHNIILEFWMDFGVIFGSLLFATLLTIYIKGLLSADTVENKGLVLSLIFGSFFMLFLSDSILNVGFPMLLLGICVGNIRKSRMSYDQNKSI